MKNIVLLSRNIHGFKEEWRKSLIERLISDDDKQIVLLMINPYDDKRNYNSKKILRVITSMEIEYSESMNGLDYETVSKLKESQLHVENYMYRFWEDYQLGKYYYYTALSYWTSFFDNNKIDIVINTQTYHGFVWDVACDIAESRGIPCVFLDSIGYNNTFTIMSRHSLYPVEYGKIPNVYYVLDCCYKKGLLDYETVPKNIFRQLLYKVGGNILEDFGRRLVKWDWRPRSLARQRAEGTWEGKLVGYVKLQSIKRYVNKITQNPDYGEKYVFYALHFEPEAIIQSRLIFENQLAVIKMLSDTLPKGWKLYVKEHPAQFDVNNDLGYAFLYSTPNFKKKTFYKKIVEMKNVKLIKTECLSADLIRHCQAVTSIVGTVLFEGVLQKKPIIVFSDLQPMAYLREAFSIHSYDECVEAMRKIAVGVKPDYADADDTAGRYIFKGDYITDNIMSLLYKLCISGE